MNLREKYGNRFTRDAVVDTVLAILLVLGSLSLFVPSANASVPASRATAHETTLRLQFTDGICSGTSVGPHTVLTATHCVVGGPLVSINDQPARVLAWTHDGNDHTMMIVDQTFDYYAIMHQRRLAPSEFVFYWGNPAGARDMYRQGFVLGYCQVPSQCMGGLVGSTPGVYIAGDTATLLAIPGWKGDSGAGVFDASGRLVTSVSTIVRLTPTLYAMGVFDMQFSEEQLEGIR